MTASPAMQALIRALAQKAVAEHLQRARDAQANAGRKPPQQPQQLPRRHRAA